MDISVFEVLKSMYAESSESILVLDDAWNVCWTNMSNAPDNVRERLSLPYDHWKNVTYPVAFDNTMYQCHLMCVEAAGLRVLHFEPDSEEAENLQQLAEIVQGMYAGLAGIHSLVEENESDAMRSLLNAQMGRLMRLQRIVYLRKQMCRGMRSEWEHKAIDLRFVAEGLVQRMQNLFRQFSKVSFSCSEDYVFVNGDLPALQCSVTSAYLLCVRKPEQHQRIDIELKIDKDAQCAQLRFAVTEKKQMRQDLQGQVDGFGTLEAEKKMLDRYCQVYGGTAIFSQQNDSVSCIFRLPLARDTSMLYLNSDREIHEDTYFYPTDVMLSRIRYRSYFL